MSVANQNNTVSKTESLGSRVLQRRRSDNLIFFSDPDISLGSSMIGTTTGTISLTFTGENQKILANWELGSNKNLFKIYDSSLTVVKDVGTNADNNGIVESLQSFNSRFYLENTESVTGITIASSSTSIYSCTSLTLHKSFSNLKQVNISQSRVSNFATLFTKNLDRLTFDVHTGDSVRTLLQSVFPISTLKWLKLNGYNIYITDLTNYLPTSLKYISVQNLPNLVTDLGVYFNGTRTGISSAFNGSFNYSGGAKFPSVISEETTMPIDYIVNQAASMTRKLTSNELGQFLIDFANQVTSVSISSKKIRFAGTPEPSNSFSDPSQTISTYAAAKAKILSLGISLTFN